MNVLLFSAEDHPLGVYAKKKKIPKKSRSLC